LIVMIDGVFIHGVTLLEELLTDAEKDQPLHLFLSSPGGDGEVAVRLVRALQARCSELTIIVPGMAKSAATIICLGADHILMGPASDLGPVDPQFQIGAHLVGAKEIERAVESAEKRVQEAPDAYPLYAGLLADVNMLMVEQARSAMARSYDLIKEALICSGRELAAPTTRGTRLRR
jgi:ClpP class serine protease